MPKSDDEILIQSMNMEISTRLDKNARDAWIDAMDPIYDIAFPTDAPQEFEASVNAWLLDNLIFTKVAFGEQKFIREHRHLHQDDLEYLSLQIYTKGRGHGVLGDIPVTMSPGSIHILDFRRNWQAICEESAVDGIIIPYSAIGYDPSVHPAHMEFDITSPVGRVLYSAIHAMTLQLPHLEEEAAPAIAAGFGGLLRGLLISSAEQPNIVDEARAMAMRDFIDENLSRMTLSAKHLCQAFDVSRATVYRAFEESGGLQRYIIQRRLERAFSDLAMSPPTRGRVVRAAEDWGFTSVSHFSRLFRARFDMSPSELASATYEKTPFHRRMDPQVRSSVNFKPWLRRL